MLLPVMSQNFVAHRAACIGCGQQLVDLAGALVRPAVGEERREPPAGVGSEPMVSMVTRRRNSLSLGQVGRHDVEPSQLGEDFAVDVVVYRNFRVHKVFCDCDGDERPCRGHLSAVRDDDRRLAGLLGLDLSERRDGGNQLILRPKLAKWRRVGAAAVGKLHFYP